MTQKLTRGLRGKQTPERGPRWVDDAVSESGHEGKRLAILEAAAKLFKEHGFHRVGIGDIAAALNVTKPSIYYYVGNKEEILVLIRQLACTRLTEGLPELFASNHTGVELLEHVLQRYGEWATSDLGQCALRLIRTQLSPRNADSIRKLERSFERQVKIIFDRGMADGTIKQCNPSMAQMALFGALNWLAFWYDADRARLDRTEISRLFAEIMLQGIAQVSAHTQLSALTAGLHRAEGAD